jgi:hypothetical protein
VEVRKWKEAEVEEVEEEVEVEEKKPIDCFLDPPSKTMPPTTRNVRA